MPTRDSWQKAVSRASTAAKRSSPQTRFALRVDRSNWSFEGGQQTKSNSLIKATVMVAYLRQKSVRSRALTASEKAILGAMIRHSENSAVNSLISNVGGVSALSKVGRLVGMKAFTPVSGMWGTSQITMADEVRLFSSISRVLPPRHRRFGVGLLRSVISEQRWGAAKAKPAGWKLLFKSGWDGRGHVVQAARFDCHGHTVTLAIAADAASHGAAISKIEQTARILLQPLRRRAATACSSVQ